MDIRLLLDSGAQKTSFDGRFGREFSALLDGAATVNALRGGAGGTVLSTDTRRLDKLDLHIAGKTVNMAAVPFLLPVTIYFVYATRVLPGLRVFKHVLRGYSYQNLGRLKEALTIGQQALAIAEETSKQGRAAAVRQILGHACLALGELPAAREHFEAPFQRVDGGGVLGTWLEQ